MLNKELLKETLNTANLEWWERNRMTNGLTSVPVPFHATGCSLGETKEILRLFSVERLHQAICQWVHRVADSVGDP